jgi:molybdenum cofactor biosynthesis enzyme MoaA
VDLRPALRATHDEDVTLRQILERSWTARDDRYSEVRFSARPLRKIEMSYIGG